VVFGTWSYGDALRRAGPELKAVLEVAGAHDHHTMDYQLCFDRGIEVASCAHAFGPAVAELGLGLTLAATRGIVENDRDFRSGTERWLHEGNVGFDALRGKSVGLVGCGGLAVSLLPMLRPLGVRFAGYDPYRSDEWLAEQGIDRIDLEELFDSCDVIYVLAAPTATSARLVGRPLLERLSPHQTLVLLSRAHVVDFDALTELLLQGRFRAGIDVFPSEPLPAEHPIRGASNAVLSSHRAGAVPAALLAIGDMIVDEVEAIIGGSARHSMQYLTADRLPELLQAIGRS
jgi:phosphoglycerate dehydrogenase-like enzyme